MSAYSNKRGNNRTRGTYLDTYPLPPGQEVLISAFLIAHARHNGKDLHIKSDGSTTMGGLPVMGLFAPSKKPRVNHNGRPASDFSNIFRLEDGCWRLKFGGIEVPQEPYSVGLHYSHALIQRQSTDVSSSRLVLLVNGEPVEIMDEQELLDGDVATTEAPSPNDGNDVVTSVVTTQFLDEIMSDEDRGRIWDSVVVLENKSKAFRAKGDVIDAITSQEEATELRVWLEKHLPNTDGAYFDNQATRDRKSVGNAIGRAIERLEQSHPLLAVHLHESIQMGLSCCYRPTTPTRWLL